MCDMSPETEAPLGREAGTASKGRTQTCCLEDLGQGCGTADLGSPGRDGNKCSALPTGRGEGERAPEGRAALPPLLTSLGMKCFFADAHLQHRQILAFSQPMLSSKATLNTGIGHGGGAGGVMSGPGPACIRLVKGLEKVLESRANDLCWASLCRWPQLAPQCCCSRGS